ncbi:hypothetical protein SAMN04487970_10494 [Paenibacillus tianmuensis]|uniref:Peptidase family S41 n=2 Tax=Paenibacillus tianmuensis TaxID=624147 RepID=A0A1G4TDT5_9BACL|nr:hypothetical protein SAMN04487970_10494 [Paenibacillus tianmuensis]
MRWHSYFFKKRGQSKSEHVITTIRQNFYKLFLIVSLLIIISSSSPLDHEKKLQIMNWEEDLHVLSHELTSRHADAFFKITKEQFYVKVEEVRAQIPNLTASQVIVKLMELVALIGDSHTTVQQTSTSMLPFSLFNFSSGIYVVSSTPEFQFLIGQRLMEINGYPIASVKERYRDIIPHENEYWVSYQFPKYLKNLNLMYGLGFNQGKHENRFMFQNSQGGVQEIRIRSGTEVEDTVFFSKIGKDVPLFLRNQSENYWYEYLSKNHTLYFKYNRCLEMKEKSIANITDMIMDDSRKHEIRKVVFDLRFNEGGRSDLLEPLIEKLRFNQNSHFKVYVIINNGTFSAGVSTAISLKNKLNEFW